MGDYLGWIIFGAIAYAIYSHFARSKEKQSANYANDTPNDAGYTVYDRWVMSENGNWTISTTRKRITVFEGYKGWTVCIADGEDDDDPEYASDFKTQEEAMDYATSQLPSRLRSLPSPLTNRIG